MTTEQAHPVLRYLRKLVASPGLEALSDGQLLERFVAAQEEAAFAALVRRHGPLVLGVCRRLLRGHADAEDAFQATFVILFRRARSLGRRGSLAGWLYTVAYHVALRARAAAARRRLQERRVVEMPQTECHAETVWRDLQPVLDDELNRLPEKHRVLVLLCYVEGKTNEEASRLLRLPAGTVKSRLARARETLRRRLARRGITLTGAALVAVLADKAAANVPSLLVASTLQTTLLLASGAAAPASVPAVVLAEGVLKAMFVTKLKIATAILVTASLLALGAGVLSGPLLAQRTGAPQASVPAEAAGQKDQPAKSAPAPAQRKEKKEIAVTGRVLDDKGKPVPGAKVDLVAWEVQKFSTWERYAIERTEFKARTTSDADGRFRLTTPELPPFYRRAAVVLARAPGHALDWAPVSPDAGTANFELRLPPEGHVAGKLVNLQGGPVAGVKIHASRLTRKKGEGWITLPLPDDAITATTDDQGRFNFGGIGKGTRSAHLEINDLHCAPKEWDVMVAGNEEKAAHQLLVLTPPQVIEGRVVCEDTGKPMPYARLEVDTYVKSAEGYTTGGGSVLGQADAQGRFKVSAMPGNTGFVMAIPPAGQPYLKHSTNFDWPKGTVRQEVEVKVPRGLLLHGKVTEAGTGRPLANASVQDDYAGWGRAFTAADGSYTLAVPPGRVHLAVTAPTPDYIAEPGGSAELLIGKPGGDPLYFHAAATLDLKKGEQPKEMSFALRRGVTLKGTLADPDGKPVKDAVLLVGRLRPPWEKALTPIEIHNGHWELRGCDPERTYHLLFLACPDHPQLTMTAEGVGSTGRLMLPMLLGPKNKLGAAVGIPAKKASGGSIEVRLQPTGSARLRFHDAQGKILPNHNPSVELVVSPGPTFAKALQEGTLAGESVYLAAPIGQPGKNPSQADDAGTIIVEGLIPGATYRLRNFQQPEIFKEFTVESGKRAEVDVTVK